MVSKELDVAISAAKAGGKILTDFYGNLSGFNTKGSPYNLVTQADLNSEKKIVSILKKAFPSHGIMAEEGSNSNKDFEKVWIIDPLDGTTNFAHSFQYFCVSIALKFKSEIVLGVVFDPLRKELFYAEKGKGAFLNGKKIHVSKKLFPESLLITGFSYDRSKLFDMNIENFSALYKQVHGIRRNGAAALDLCQLACGRADGYWEFSLKPWDIAAGQLIVKEAGGKVTNEKGNLWLPENDSVIASNDLIHDDLIKRLKVF